MNAAVARAVVVADGDVAPGLDAAHLLDGGGAGGTLVIAADGGARKAAAAGLTPDLVVGDADSLGALELDELRRRGAEVRVLPVAKDESDTEAAVREAISRAARSILVLGALGGRRFEHALANVGLLALPELEGRDVTLGDGLTSVRLVGRARGAGRLELAGEPGDYISLLPLDSAVDGVRTDGLRYPLDGERLVLGPSRGLSNELLGAHAAVAVERGRLLVIHTPRPHAGLTAERRVQRHEGASA